MTPKARVRPVRVHVPSAELHTTVVRGVGFRVECSCRAPFKRRRTRAAAVADQIAHVETHRHEPRVRAVGGA